MKLKQNILRRLVLVLAATAICITGSYILTRHRAEQAAPAASSAADVPVIVLDAGHGESTETEFGYSEKLSRMGELLFSSDPLQHIFGVW